MSDFFNKLTPAELERLSILSEELSEAGHVIGKILRHGYESHHPDGGASNRELLEKELGDVRYATLLLSANRDVRQTQINWYADKKSESIPQYLHHQSGAVLPRPTANPQFDGSALGW